MAFIIALCMAAIGVIPLLIGRKFLPALFAGCAYVAASFLVVYFGVLSLVWPLFGGIGALTVGYLLISAWIASLQHNDIEPTLAVWALPLLALGVLVIRGCSGCNALNTSEYAGLIGDVDKREWTQDVQPKDPTHVRIVSLEHANFLADKQFGSVPGAIGSQFQIEKQYLTLQIVRGELVYVAPLDFRGYRVWTKADAAPGYVLISATDPFKPVRVIVDRKFKYMPGAFFGDNLERYLWSNGYMTKGLTDFSFELDENLKPWWVVSVFEPTIAYWGQRTLGVLTVDPENGAMEYYPMGEVPEWIDRAVPRSFVKSYIEYAGSLSGGWWNSWWGGEGLTEPEEPSLVYGSDGMPYWVTSITSKNEKDESMVGLYYTSSRTGKTTFYHAKGSTEAAVLTAVNNKVSYMKRHGDSPVLYNIYGTMAYIVPVLGEDHTFQGVSICDVENLLVALGSNEVEAYRQYQKLLASVGQNIAPDQAHNESELTGTVERFVSEVRESGTLYFMRTRSLPNVIFTGGSELSVKLPLTQTNDLVKLRFVDSGEGVVPLTYFDNLSIALRSTRNEADVRERGEASRAEVRTTKEDRSVRSEVQNLSNEELKKLLELKREQEKKK